MQDVGVWGGLCAKVIGSMTLKMSVNLESPGRSNVGARTVANASPSGSI